MTCHAFFPTLNHSTLPCKDFTPIHIKSIHDTDTSNVFHTKYMYERRWDGLINAPECSSFLKVIKVNQAIFITFHLD